PSPCKELPAKGLELDREQLRREFDLSGILHKPFSPRKLTELILQCLELANDIAVGATAEE
ncbi:MAG: hypothetical protein AAFU85_28910, partial [Planctomycetota bacterium]